MMIIGYKYDAYDDGDVGDVDDDDDNNCITIPHTMMC